MPNTTVKKNLLITPDSNAKRLDQALSLLLPQYSRALLQSWIKAGFVRIDNLVVIKQNLKVHLGQNIIIEAPLISKTLDKPEDLALNIVYEDADILVINKPAGMVVHPGAGRTGNTLLNALLHHDPKLKKLPRAGIVHRLDKDTSGLLVVARNLESHKALIEMLREHDIQREYETIVWGDIISGGEIDAPIGRHKTKRTLMAVVEGGKSAVTQYRILHRFTDFTHLKVMLKTGRTHQIRVHMAHIHHPVVGDPIYGQKYRVPKNASAALRKFLENFSRQALHAKRLVFLHPRTQSIMEFTTPLPKDIKNLLSILTSDQQK